MFAELAKHPSQTETTSPQPFWLKPLSGSGVGEVSGYRTHHSLSGAVELLSWSSGAAANVVAAELEQSRSFEWANVVAIHTSGVSQQQKTQTV